MTISIKYGLKKYKIVDSKGKTVDTFVRVDTARAFLRQLKKDYFGEELKIEEI